MLGAWVAVVTAVMGSSGSGEGGDDNGIMGARWWWHYFLSCVVVAEIVPGCGRSNGGEDGDRGRCNGMDDG